MKVFEMFSGFGGWSFGLKQANIPFEVVGQAGAIFWSGWIPIFVQAVTIKHNESNDGGLALGVDTDGEGATGYTWHAVAGDDTFTMPSTGVSGGVVGDMIRVTDYAAGFFLIEAHIQQSGGAEVTPFTAGV